MSPSDKHNALAREFALKVLRETRTYSEVMVVVESCVLASMLAISRVHNVSDRAAVEMAEAAVHRATERFVEARKS